MNKGSSKTSTNTSIKNNYNKNGNSKEAIIYFSTTGTTRTIAEYIKNYTNGDLIEITPKEKYTSSDLDYGNNDSRANKEQNNTNARPEIENKIDISNYDVIYLGYPIWWGDVPKIILTFLDNNDLTGKKVIPFSTSHSSGMQTSLNTLKNYNNNIKWLDGKRFSSSSSQNEVNDWIKSVNK